MLASLPLWLAVGNPVRGIDCLVEIVLDLLLEEFGEEVDEAVCK